MPPSRRTPGSRSEVNRDIRKIEKQYRALLARRAEIEAGLPEKPRRISQDEVAADLAEHPGSTYTEVAQRLDASPIVIAQHLSRGVKSGRFSNPEVDGQKSGRFSNTDDGPSAKG
jgi:hypothetical protein